MKIYKKLSKTMADNKIYLKPKHNTIFTAMIKYGDYNELVTSAISGLKKLTEADLVLLRGRILPDAERLSQKVKTASNKVNSDVGGTVNIHTVEYNNGVDLLEELNYVSTSTVFEYTELPVVPLIIEWDKDTVNGNLKFDSITLNNHVSLILAQHSDDYIKSLHDAVFSSISKDNTRIKDLSIYPLSNVHDIFITLVIAIGYARGTIGVANKPPAIARNSYIYRLIGVLTTILTNYKKLYQQYLKNNVLILKCVTGKQGRKDITVIGELYKKFLQEHSVDVIIGATHTNDDIDHTRLDELISSENRYLSAMSDAIKVSNMKNKLDVIHDLRAAYKMVFHNYINDLSDDTLSEINLAKNQLAKLHSVASDYVNNLSESSLIDQTEVCRIFVGSIVYDRADFYKFTDDMNYYHKIFPEYDVNQLATAAMISLVISRLDSQIYTVKN